MQRPTGVDADKVTATSGHTYADITFAVTVNGSVDILHEHGAHGDIIR